MEKFIAYVTKPEGKRGFRAGAFIYNDKGELVYAIKCPDLRDVLQQAAADAGTIEFLEVLTIEEMPLVYNPEE
ncbi:MAG: hypothetical protein WC451_03335 [Patescibacteria group bacterium]|jgi:hypothetical protein